MTSAPVESRVYALRARQVVDSFWGAMLGAGVYAAWAIFANRDAGMRVAITVGIAHWLTSTFLTYTGTGVMRRSFALGNESIDSALITFVTGLAYTYLVLLCVHHAIGTPHVLLTLAAGVIPNVLFCSSYALLLARTMPPKNPGVTMNPHELP